MAEPGKIVSVRGGNYTVGGERTRTYAQTMNQYNRILRRFSEMADNGDYTEADRRREKRVEEIMNRYADNISQSQPYLRTLQNELNRGVAEGRDGRASRDAAWAAADRVAIPYSTYARRRNNRR